MALKISRLSILFAIAVIAIVFYGVLVARFVLKLDYGVKYSSFLVGSEMCDKLLLNISDGKWISNLDLITDNKSEEYRKLAEEIERFDKHISEYRIQRGMHIGMWRDDLKCGYLNSQKKPIRSNWQGDVGGWCDAKSGKPCCSDLLDGVCGTECECPKCVDMRKIYHAEFSTWVTNDARCQRRNYTTEAACDVIGRFSNFAFVGDSLNRLLTQGFLVLARGDIQRGSLPKTYNRNQIKSCLGADQFNWRGCSLGVGKFKKFLANQSALCGMDLDRFATYFYPSVKEADKFLDLVKSFTGKKGTVIFVSVGVWMKCTSNLATSQYLGPAVTHLNNFYKNNTIKGSLRWPQIIFLPPDTVGILKPKQHIGITGNVPCGKYAEEMTKYCNENDIPMLNIRKLTQGIHSYDGTHYGMAANLMKAQLLLNWLDSISVGKNWSTSAS